MIFIDIIIAVRYCIHASQAAYVNNKKKAFVVLLQNLGIIKWS